MPSQPAALTSHVRDYTTLIGNVIVSKGCENLAHFYSLAGINGGGSALREKRCSRTSDNNFALRCTPSGSVAAPVDAVQWPFKPIRGDFEIETKVVSI